MLPFFHLFANFRLLTMRPPRSLLNITKQSFLRNQLVFMSSTQSQSKLKKVNLDHWKASIGLEIHAQINSQSKLFSGCGTSSTASVNNQVSVFDESIPGTLPRLNRVCVEKAIQTAAALHCRINTTSYFDRKHYFYADLPAGYQITQYRRAIANDGYFDYFFQCPNRQMVVLHRAQITQIQLEQDSGKSLLDDRRNLSLIDLNRAGIGLMEIITGIDFDNGSTAAEFVRQLSEQLRVLQVCQSNLSQGHLRVDANVSVAPLAGPGESFPLGVRTEVKNLNSLRSISDAIDYEIKRHVHILRSGGSVVNETLTFDPNLGKTLSMRDKEEVQDYRFFPEPNLPPLQLVHQCDKCKATLSDHTETSCTPNNHTNVCIQCSQLNIPVPQNLWPSERRQLVHKEWEYPDLNVVSNLISYPDLFHFFECVMRALLNITAEIPVSKLSKETCFWIVGMFKGEFIKKYGPDTTALTQWSASNAQNMAEFVLLNCQSQLTVPCAKRLLNLLFQTDFHLSANQIARENNMIRITTTEEIQKICNDAFTMHPDMAAKFFKNSKKAKRFFLSKVVELSDDRCDSISVANTLDNLLK